MHGGDFERVGDSPEIWPRNGKKFRARTSNCVKSESATQQSTQPAHKNDSTVTSAYSWYVFIRY